MVLPGRMVERSSCSKSRYIHCCLLSDKMPSFSDHSTATAWSPKRNSPITSTRLPPKLKKLGWGTRHLGRTSRWNAIAVFCTSTRPARAALSGARYPMAYSFRTVGIIVHTSPLISIVATTIRAAPLENKTRPRVSNVGNRRCVVHACGAER